MHASVGTYDCNIRTKRVATSDNFWELAGKCLRLPRARLGLELKNQEKLKINPYIPHFERRNEQCCH